MEAVSQADFDQKVVQASHHRPVLVDYWGPRCGPCLKLMPWVDKLADEVADTATIVKLNTAENRRLAIGSSGRSSTLRGRSRSPSSP